MKESNEEIIALIDKAIMELCYNKTKLLKAYNYYNGIRDPEQFRHLEENFGIGTPTAVEFVPLVRKHIDVLIGEYLSINVIPKISCKDKKTISNIHRDKQIAINKAVIDSLKSHLTNTILASVAGKQGSTDEQVQNEINNTVESLNRSFISDYEIAGQNIAQYLMQSRNIDFANKRKILLTDLLITGTCYYKVYESDSKSNVSLRVLNPLNTFIDRNPNSPYLKDSARSVIREYLTKAQILVKYGAKLTDDDIAILDNLEDYNQDASNSMYIRSFDSTIYGGGESDSQGILGGYEVTPLMPYERVGTSNYKLYPVYEVEWLDTKRENGEFKMYRYEGVRIGTKIYIPFGRSENVVRSMDNPNVCQLSVNGIFYSDRNNDPFSLVLATANLQDKFDVLNFYRDNLISESGAAGDWIDVAFIPKMFGDTLMERLMKWKAYKKTGLAVIDSSQEGAIMNTTFGGYDDTIKLQAIQAIHLAIQNVEDTCSTITGVFREKLGGIEQKDAVTNVKVGVQNSNFITKQYYQLMDLMTREILLDSLNLAKIVYKKGISGTLILGDRLSKIFTALPEHYTITDYDIHIADSSEILKEQQLIQQLVMEMIKSGSAELDTLIEAVTAKGLTEMRESVINSISKKKQENNQLSQMSQQLEQLTNQLKELQQQNGQLQNKLQASNEEKLKLDRDKLNVESEIKWYVAKNKAEYDSEMLALQDKRVRLEGAQLFDDNLNNDEIKND